MTHQLPKLPYAYDALEPWIDAATMEIHHAKHHATYVAKLNEALEKHPELGETALEDMLKSLDSVPEDIRLAVRNHGGGHFNHSLFWQSLAPNKTSGNNHPEDPMLTKELEDKFGGYDKFREKFTGSALSVFGSGWTWLVSDQSGSLSIMNTQNQDTPLALGLRPILGLDLWEHAYYLKHQNRRADYVESWWQVIDWPALSERLLKK